MDEDIYNGGGAAEGADVAELQAQLESCRAALEGWESVFQDDPCCEGGKPERTRSEEAREAERRCQALLLRCDATEAEAAELRAQLHAALFPAGRRVEGEDATLLLDPGAVRELSRLGGVCEAQAEALKAKDEEIQALGFSKESKQGRMLMARVRTLIKENEEFGMALSEGRLHSLEQQVALLRTAAQQALQREAELKDALQRLSAENEELQIRAFGKPPVAAEAAAPEPAPQPAAKKEEPAAASSKRARR